MDPLIQLVYSNPQKPDLDVFLWYNDKDQYTPTLDDWKKRLECLHSVEPIRFFEYAFQMFSNFSVATTERPMLLMQWMLTLTEQEQQKILTQYNQFSWTEGNIKKFQRAKDLLLNPKSIRLNEAELQSLVIHVDAYNTFLQLHHAQDQERIIQQFFKDNDRIINSLTTEQLTRMHPTLDDVAWDVGRAIIQRWTLFAKDQGFCPFKNHLQQEHTFFEHVKHHPRLIEILQSEVTTIFQTALYSDASKSIRFLPPRTSDTSEKIAFLKSIYQWILSYGKYPDILQEMYVFETPVEYQKLTKKQIPIFHHVESAMVWMLNLHPDDYDRNKEDIWKKMPTPSSAIIKKILATLRPEQCRDLILSPLYQKVIESIWSGNATHKQYMVGVLSNKLGIPWNKESSWMEKACVMAVIIEHLHQQHVMMPMEKITNIKNTIRVHAEILGPVETSEPPWSLLHTLRTQVNVEALDCSDVIETLEKI